MPKSIVIVVCSHRNKQAWQQQIVTWLSERGMIPYILRYGLTDDLALTLPWGREQLFSRFRQSFTEILADSGIKRPSILCHGVGPWLTSELLNREPAVKLDKVLLVDTSAGANTLWPNLLKEQRILALHHEAGIYDGTSAVRDRPTSFDDASATSKDHSDSQCSRWSAFFAQPLISPEDQHQLQSVLINAHTRLSQDWGLRKDTLRLGVFLHDKNQYLVKATGTEVEPLSSAVLTSRWPVQAEDIPVSTSFRENKAVIRQDFGMQGLTDAPCRMSAAAPLRAPKDGQLIGALAVESHSPTATLPAHPILRAHVMEEAALLAATLANRSSGY